MANYRESERNRVKVDHRITTHRENNTYRSNSVTNQYVGKQSTYAGTNSHNYYGNNRTMSGNVQRTYYGNAQASTVYSSTRNATMRQEAYKDYNHGSNARKMQVAPNYEPEIKRKKAAKVRRKPTGREAVKVESALMNAKYVIFLCVIASVLACTVVSYLGLRSRISVKATQITRLQSQVADLKVENDAALGIVGQTVNLESVKNRAGEMGMTFVEPENIITYELPLEDVVVQYENIPDSGILPQSEKTSE